WHIVRDRNRWAWLRGGRAFGQPGPAPVAAALPRGAARQHRSWPEAFAMKARSLIQAHQLLVSGTPLAEAARVALLIHGRHASAEVILPLADRLATPGVCFLAPSAETGSWYPGLFMGPIADNEPFLSRSLDRLGAILHSVNELGFDVATEIVLTGFSQGACLVIEYAARHPRRYAGILGFTGGRIGPDPMRREETGSFEGTPVFIGCSEKDPFIPARRVL